MDSENVAVVLISLATIAGIFFFYKATRSSAVLLLILLATAISAALGANGFYQNTVSLPPRFIFLPGPTLLAFGIFFLSQKGKLVLQTSGDSWLTLLHLVRIPVEFSLYQLFQAGMVPSLMTYEGYNFDILSGLTAPVIYYLVFVKGILNKKWLLAWNLICLLLLVNIVTLAILSAKTPFQQLAFDQPNIAVVQFPFVWLPAVIVPLVLVSHLLSITKILHSFKA